MALRKCTAALRQLGRSAKWSEAISILQQLHQHGPTPNLITYNATLNVCAKARRWNEALKLLQNCMALRLADTQSYNTVLERGADRHRVQVIDQGLLAGYEKRFQWQQAIQAAFHQGIRLDVISYNSLTSACEKGQQWQAALALFSQMQQERSHVQRWSLVICLLSDMHHKLLQPNVITYSAAASACEKGHRWAEVLELLGQMDSEDLQPNVITFTAAVRACELLSECPDRCHRTRRNFAEHRANKLLWVACHPDRCRRTRLKSVGRQAKEACHPDRCHRTRRNSVEHRTNELL
eukprot:g10299.t1